MRKVLTLIALCALSYSAFAQKQYKKGQAIGLHMFFTDFATAKAIKDTGFGNAFKNKDSRDIGKMSPGLGISFHKGITDHIDWSLMGGLTFLDYPLPGGIKYGANEALLTLDVNAQVKLLSDKHCVTPYLNVGLGASSYRRFFGLYAPLGAGLQFNVNNGLFILANTQYRLALTDKKTTNNLFHSIGVAGSISSERPVAVIAPPTPPAIEPPKDTDKDGVIDTQDECPSEAGSANLKGCPDKDGDGIADKNDKCPDVSGVAKYEGCPVPDTDGDGVNDDNDKCPAVAGVARNQGCPIPDGDGDGVNDEEDRCPAVAGLASNQGCPEVKDDVVKVVNYAAKNILFSTGSAKLLTSSNKSLNDIIKVMEDDTNLKLDINGYADNTGDAERNRALSEERANAVLEYFTAKGIDASRLSATGFGSENPIADNKTAAGRAKNRRVELKLSY
jgi:OmpA-OmpF porin, OOP family